MDVRTSLWIRSRGNEYAQLRRAMAAAVVHSFLVDGHMYDLCIYPGAIGETFDFNWVRRGCNLVPPLEGSLVVRRLGPLTALTLHAYYRIGDDIASRIAQKLVGRNAAYRSLSYASRAFAKLISTQHTTARKQRHIA
jgi:hypothetical protein